MDRAPKKGVVDGQAPKKGAVDGQATPFSPDESTMALFTSIAGITSTSMSTAVVQARVEQARSTLMSTFPYKCVQEYRFASARSLLHPEYATLLARHQARLGPPVTTPDQPNLE